MPDWFCGLSKISEAYTVAGQEAFSFWLGHEGARLERKASPALQHWHALKAVDRL